LKAGKLLPNSSLSLSLSLSETVSDHWFHFIKNAGNFYMVEQRRNGNAGG
jgi:hypothetical protein